MKISLGMDGEVLQETTTTRNFLSGLSLFPHAPKTQTIDSVEQSVCPLCPTTKATKVSKINSKFQSIPPSAPRAARRINSLLFLATH